MRLPPRNRLICDCGRKLCGGFALECLRSGTVDLDDDGLGNVQGEQATNVCVRDGRT